MRQGSVLTQFPAKGSARSRFAASPVASLSM